MKKILSVSVVLTISFIVISMLVVCGTSGAADKSSAKQEAAKSGAPAGGGTAAKELASSYKLQLLVANADTPVETLTFKKDNTGLISATMECVKYGKQSIPVVFFDGESVKFIALSGSNHDENFYFELKYYGSFLLGEAEGGRGPIPVVVKETKYWK